MLTKELVHELFEYKEGNLYWKIARSNRIKVGQIVGCVHEHGYRYTNLNKKPTLVHRLVFLYHHGYMPEFIDHIDGNRSNNLISNLREATRNQNAHNAKKRKDNTSGIKGIHWDKKRNKWRACFEKNKKNYDAGFFESIEQAQRALIDLRNAIHGNFAKH